MIGKLIALLAPALRIGELVNNRKYLSLAVVFCAYLIISIKCALLVEDFSQMSECEVNQIRTLSTIVKEMK